MTDNPLNMLPRDVLIADLVESVIHDRIAMLPAGDSSGEDDRFASTMTICELIMARAFMEHTPTAHLGQRLDAATMVGKHLLHLTIPGLDLRPLVN